MLKLYLLKSLTESVEDGKLDVTSITESSDGKGLIVTIREPTQTVDRDLQIERVKPDEPKPEKPKRKYKSRKGRKIKPAKDRAKRLKPTMLKNLIVEYLPSEVQFARSPKEVAADMNRSSHAIKTKLNELEAEGRVKETTGGSQYTRYIKVGHRSIDETEDAPADKPEEQAQEPDAPEKTEIKKRRLSFRAGQQDTVEG